MNFQKLIIGGHLTKAPELRTTQSGSTVASFGMAVNRSYKVNDEKREEVLFLDFVAFGRSAEVLAQYVSKGDPLLVEAHLKLEQWEDKKSGQKRSKHVAVVDTFQLVGGKGDKGEDGPKARGKRDDRDPTEDPSYYGEAPF